MTALRAIAIKLPLIVLMLLLGALTLAAWLAVGGDDDGIAVTNPAEGIDSITWAATVRDDGRLSVRITYDLDDTPRDMSIRLPAGARFLAVNDEPLGSDIGKYATTRAVGPTTVSYELPGRITRYRDGAILRLGRAEGGVIDGDEALFPCPRCYIDPIGYGNVAVFGQLTVPNAAQVGLTFVKLSSVRSEADGSSVRFAGINEGVDDVSMLAVLPADAVPRLPVGDGSVAQALDRLSADLAATGEPLSEPTSPGQPGMLTAVLLTALLGGFVVWTGVQFVWRRGADAAQRRAAESEGLLHSSPVKPDELSPALAGLVVGDTGPGHQSAVAATILDLIRRDVISITSGDARRFVLHIPGGVAGGGPFERAVLASLRPIGHPRADIEVAGPPLWTRRGSSIARDLEAALLQVARRDGLVRSNLSVKVLAPLALAMGIIAIVGGITGLGWLVAIAGPLLAIPAALLSGAALTVRGRFERDQWLPYAEYLRGRADLEHVSPQSVHQHGEPLIYAAALGGASTVAECMSPNAPFTDG